MNRSAALGIALLGVLGGLPADAQQAGKTYRVGILSGRTLAIDRPLVDALRRTLSALDYHEGTNLELDYRGSAGAFEKLSDLAVDLVRRKPDAIVAAGGRATVAAKRATTSIPIVMTENLDPVGSGLVSSLAHPGGNVTGTTLIPLNGKLIQLLKELAPRLRRFAVVGDPYFISNVATWLRVESMARTIGAQAVAVGIQSPDQIDADLERIPNLHADAVFVLADASTKSNMQRIVRFLAAQRLPAVYSDVVFASAGGLLAYGASGVAIWSQAATYVDRILKGAKPADLPVEQPTTFELVVNLKVARELGITIPQSILLQATHVIR